MKNSQPSNPPKRKPPRKKSPKIKIKVTAAPVAPREPDAPHWLPTDHRWNELPAELREAVPKILTPAYRRFVLEAPDELERSMGMTLVHLMWLEICGQLQLAVAAGDAKSLDAILGDPEAMIDRHLSLVATKCQTAELLVKLRALGKMLGDRPDSCPGNNGSLPFAAPPFPTPPLPSPIQSAIPPNSVLPGHCPNLCPSKNETILIDPADATGSASALWDVTAGLSSRATAPNDLLPSPVIPSPIGGKGSAA